MSTLPTTFSKEGNHVGQEKVLKIVGIRDERSHLSFSTEEMEAASAAAINARANTIAFMNAQLFNL
jgi:hypothetical protein